MEKNFFNVKAIKNQTNSTGGNLTRATVDEVSGFVNISFAELKLNKKGFLEPMWHPNAGKIGHCLQGNGWVSIRNPSSVETFTICEGDVFFIPQGYIHTISNTGEKELQIIFALNNGKPQEMFLTKAVHSLSESVFCTTFNTHSDFYKGLKQPSTQQIIGTLPSIKESTSNISSRFKFNIKESSKPILTQGGYLQAATKANLPVLDGLGILGFGLNPGGAVEPHWHTNAGELIYIVKGQTRITVLSPEGKVDVLEVKGGEGAFAPASHFHNIENIGKENVEVIAFFNDASPDYIGIGEVVGAYSNEVLSSLFNVSPNYFDNFKKPTGPLVIVPLESQFAGAGAVYK